MSTTTGTCQRHYGLRIEHKFTVAQSGLDGFLQGFLPQALLIGMFSVVQAVESAARHIGGHGQAFHRQAQFSASGLAPRHQHHAGAQQQIGVLSANGATIQLLIKAEHNGLNLRHRLFQCCRIQATAKACVLAQTSMGTSR